MNIFVAGATGVIGRPLLQLLRDAGHTVTGTTRSADKDRRRSKRSARMAWWPTPSTPRRCARGRRGEARRRDPSAHRSAGRQRSGADGRSAREEFAAPHRGHAQSDGGGEGRGRAARGGAEHRLRLRARAQALPRGRSARFERSPARDHRRRDRAGRRRAQHARHRRHRAALWPALRPGHLVRQARAAPGR